MENPVTNKTDKSIRLMREMISVWFRSIPIKQPEMSD